MPNVPQFRLTASSPEATLVIDARMRICRASAAAHQLLGYRPDSLTNVLLAWLLPPAPPPPPPEALAPRSQPATGTHPTAQGAAQPLSARLATCLDLLHWLDMHMLGETRQDDPKQRAHARVVVNQAAELLEACRSALKVHAD